MGEGEQAVQDVLGADDAVGERHQETRAVGSHCDHAFDWYVAICGERLTEASCVGPWPKSVVMDVVVWREGCCRRLRAAELQE